MLLLRDILDSPEETTRVWRKNGCFEAIEAYYDQVLVVGSPEVFDLRREYQFPPFAAAKVRFCGYIARQPGRRARADARRELGMSPTSEPLVLVTPGGGEDGHGPDRYVTWQGCTRCPLRSARAVTSSAARRWPMSNVPRCTLPQPPCRRSACRISATT